MLVEHLEGGKTAKRATSPVESPPEVCYLHGHMGVSGQNSPPQEGKYRKRTLKLQKTFSEPALHRAWEHYLNSSQGEGKDRCGIKSFGRNLRANIEHLSHAILTGAFSPSPAAKFYKPKKSGLLRTITIPRIEDALVFQAFAEVAARSERGSSDQFANHVYSAILNPASRSEPGTVAEGDDNSYFLRGDHRGLERKRQDLSTKGAFTHYLYADIHCYYDSIPHALLLDKLRADFGFTRDMCTMLGKCLNAWSGTREGPTPGVGIPQSVDSSHFFGNLYLRELDEWLIQQEGNYCRFQDDIFAFCNSEYAVEELQKGLDLQLKTLGLALNPAKTAIFEIPSDGAHVGTPEMYYDIPDHCWAEYIEGVDFGYEEEGDFGIRGDDEPEELSEDSVELDEEEKELVELATKQIGEIESEVVDLFSSRTGGSGDRNRSKPGFQKMRNHAVAFCKAARVLQKYKQLPEQPNKDAGMGWCRLLEMYHQHAESFARPLRYYSRSEETVRKLRQLVDDFRDHEYPRRQVIDNLPPGIVSDQAVKEEFLQILANENSWYVREGIYLLFHRYYICGKKNPEKENTWSAVEEHLKEESNPDLRRALAISLSEGRSDAEQHLASWSEEEAPALSKAARDYILRDHDKAVEELLDQICETTSRFRFKEPLGKSFSTAKRQARKGRKFGDQIEHQGHTDLFEDWVLACMKVLHILELRFVQEQLGKNPKRNRTKSMEVIVYEILMREEHDEVRKLGKITKKIWGKHRHTAAHLPYDKNDKKLSSDKVSLLDYTHGQILWEFKRARERFAEAGRILVDIYRKAYPSYAD